MNLINIDPKRTVLVTGLFGPTERKRFKSDRKKLEAILKNLETEIIKLYKRGYDTFISGHDDDLSILALALLRMLNRTYPDLYSVYIRPSPETDGNSYKSEQHPNIISDSYNPLEEFSVYPDVTLTISDDECPEIDDRHAEYLMQNSSVFLCYLNKKQQERCKLFCMSNAIGHEVINIWRDDII